MSPRAGASSGTVCSCIRLRLRANFGSASSPNTADGAISPSGPDDLPPFAALTTDEERERKAETRSPGTYNVVVNPESFQHLPEYSEDLDVRGLQISSRRRGSVTASMNSGSQGRDVVGDQADGLRSPTEDPNVVILRRFEDATRRAVLQRRDSRSPSSPRAAVPPPVSPVIKTESQVEEDSSISLMQQAAEGGLHSHLLLHFRKHIWRQLAQIESAAHPANRPALTGVEVLEDAARFFPPVSVTLES